MPLSQVLSARQKDALGRVKRETWLWLWASGAAVTATGRMLANAHWCTDTVAGASLGAGLVASAVLLCAAVEPSLPSAWGEDE